MLTAEVTRFWNKVTTPLKFSALKQQLKLLFIFCRQQPIMYNNHKTDYEIMQNQKTLGLKLWDHMQF